MSKKVEITMLEDNELSIDGQTKPAGYFHIEEYEDDELVGGSYATYDNISDKLKEIFDEDIFFIDVIDGKDNDYVI